MYSVWTWGDTPHPRNRHVGLGTQVIAFEEYQAAADYARTHAVDYDGGLYVMGPDGTVDTGVELVYPDGRVERVE